MCITCNNHYKNSHGDNLGLFNSSGEQQLLLHKSPKAIMYFYLAKEASKSAIFFLASSSLRIMPVQSKSAAE